MIRVVKDVPTRSSSSAVYPTLRLAGRVLYLAYFEAGEDRSAVVRFDALLDWHYGYPNDEGLDSHPLYGSGLKYYEFHEAPAGGHGERAWIITFHDGTMTVYAKSLTVVTRSFDGPPGDAINAHLGQGENQSL